MEEGEFYMKKVAIGVLALSLAFCAIPKADAATKVTEKKVQVFVDSKELKFDQSPIIKNGRVLVPVRGIYEALGAEVQWNQKEKSIKATTKDKRTIELTIGSKQATINNIGIMTLDEGAQIVNNRTMVPVRFVSQSMGADVEWEQASKTVKVNNLEILGYKWLGKQANGYYVADLFNVDNNDYVNAFVDLVIGKGYPMKRRILQLIKERGYVHKDNVRFYEANPPASLNPFIRVEWK